mmetsp:Transcript_13727/g.23533  ORF Transcript_13727/g.23533 Transcript_13727/m.23533 type:complete len:312 (+) Transcript_13727:126-1061(+)
MMKLEINTSLGVFFVAIKPPQNRQAELAQWADADVGCSASKSTCFGRGVLSASQLGAGARAVCCGQNQIGSFGHAAGAQEFLLHFFDCLPVGVFIDELLHSLLQGWHGEALPGVTEGNSSSSARHDVGIHGLVTKNGNHRQRNSKAQGFVHAVGSTVGDEGVAFLQQLQLWQHVLRQEIRRQGHPFQGVFFATGADDDLDVRIAAKSFDGRAKQHVDEFLSRRVTKAVLVSLRSKGIRPKVCRGHGARRDVQQFLAFCQCLVHSRRQLDGIRRDVGVVKPLNFGVQQRSHTFEGKVREAFQLHRCLWFHVE